MTSSNLSKIKPQLRTTGNVTGNFGRPKAKAGSSLNDLQAGNIGITQDEYLQRLYTALDSMPPRQDNVSSVIMRSRGF